MQVIFLGPPGVGKGTQAKRASEAMGIPKISTGDIFRESVENKTSMGLKAKKYMEKGELVPDEVVVGLIRGRLEQEDCASGFILDGFPRTLSQAKALESMLEDGKRNIKHVLDFNLDNGELVRRLSGRRTCLNCKAVYHLKYDPPVSSGKCDQCQGKLIQRNDDKAVTVQNRFLVYQAHTKPLIEFYEGKKLLRRIDSSGTPDEVSEKVKAVLGVRI